MVCSVLTGKKGERFLEVTTRRKNIFKNHKKDVKKRRKAVYLRGKFVYANLNKTDFAEHVPIDANCKSLRREMVHEEQHF